MNPFSPASRATLCRLLANEDVPSPFPDAALWRAAVEEGVAACLWHLYRDHPDASAGLPDDVRVELREQAMEQILVRQALGSVLDAFREAECPVICLRGQTVAQIVYDPPGLRPQNDIDLMVMPQHADDAVALLRKVGCVPTPVYPMLFEHAGVLVDLHTEPLGIERIRSWAHLTPLSTDDFFRHAVEGELEGRPALLLPLPFHLPYLCFHAMKHSFENLLWLWDIALMARRIEAEGLWDDLLESIREYRLERPCFYALAYAGAHLAAPIPEHLLAAIRPRMGGRERHLFERFMRHEAVPFLAERLFARMMPNGFRRAMFWCETVIPRREVRQQVSDTSEYGLWHFMRKRARQIRTAMGFSISSKD
jgi:hypothetical protein